MSLEALLSPPPPGAPAPRAAAWLAAAARALGGFRPVPLVVRRCGGSAHDSSDGAAGASSEIRRWSEGRFVRLGSDQLLLDEAGALHSLHPQRRRWLRRTEEEWIHDDVFELRSAGVAPAEAVDAVTGELIAQHGLLFWSRWPVLTAPQRAQLLSVPQPWGVLGTALQNHPEVAAEAIPGLLSPQAHDANRRALLSAGAESAYVPPARCLPYLLLQVEWNLSPGLLGLARGAMSAEPAAAWNWRSHANPVVRRRLAELLPGTGHAWLDWLAIEADEAVRHALRRRVEAERTAASLTDELTRSREPERRAALGWLLTHWSQPREPHLDGALGRLLTPPQRDKLQRRQARR